MKANAKAWHTSSDSERARLDRRNKDIANEIQNTYGLKMHRDDATGVWIIDFDPFFKGKKGDKLFDVYHTGGIAGQPAAGQHPGLKSNEVFAKLQSGELVISNQQKGNLFKMIDMAGALSKKMAASVGGFSNPTFGNLAGSLANTIPNNISTTNAPSINIGDVIIQGTASDATVAKHREVTRQFANEIFDFLGVRK